MSYLLCAYLFGFRGDMSIAGPGAGMSIGNMSTHISIRPFICTEVKEPLNYCMISICFMTIDKGWALPVRCRACRGSAVVWSPRVQGRACSPPSGSPPSGSALLGPNAPQSASSDLEYRHKQKEIKKGRDMQNSCTSFIYILYLFIARS